jgi:hypothetical protein
MPGKPPVRVVSKHDVSFAGYRLRYAHGLTRSM